MHDAQRMSVRISSQPKIVTVGPSQTMCNDEILFLVRTGLHYFLQTLIASVLILRLHRTPFYASYCHRIASYCFLFHNISSCPVLIDSHIIASYRIVLILTRGRTNADSDVL
jgi:hypothetical protein